MFSFSILLTIYAGFSHAFEADHLLAISNIVSYRRNMALSLKDGIHWGLGHASTLFGIGILMILFKTNIPQEFFRYGEALVGAMLIALAIYRLDKLFMDKPVTLIPDHIHLVGEPHNHKYISENGKSGPLLPYSIGLLHGLAGSGVLIVMVMSKIEKPIEGLLYLGLFGLAGMCGMILAAGLFSLPFSKKMIKSRFIQLLLVLTSSILCLIFGMKIILENLN